MRWEQEMEAMDSLAEGIGGEKGKSRTFEENKCYVLALRAYFRRRLEAGKPSTNWTEIEQAVAHDFMVNRDHITDLRKGFIQDGNIWVYGNGARGGPAGKSTHDTIMKDVVERLRQAWYGDNTFPPTHPLHKRPIDCRKLWRTCLDIAGTKFVSLCEGISGKIGSIVETEDFTNESVDFPIDTLIVDLTRDVGEDEDWSTVVNI